MALPGLGIGKKEVRQLCNDMDKLAREIHDKAQSELDRIGDRIDAELESCGRELGTTEKTLADIKSIIDRIIAQVAPKAPEDVKLLLQSGMSEIMNKVETARDNVNAVKKNIKDVDQYTDKMDGITDEIAEIVKQIDALTDNYQA